SGEPGNRCSGGVSGGGGPPSTGTDRGQPREVLQRRATGARGRVRGPGGATEDGHLLRVNPGASGGPGNRNSGRAHGSGGGPCGTCSPSNRRIWAAQPSEAPPSHTWRGLVLLCSSAQLVPVATRRKTTPRAITQI